MVLAKIFAISLAGVAGVLGSTSPLIHIGVTKSDWKNKWYPRAVGFEEPVLKNCEPTDENGKLWNLFLIIEGGATTQDLSKAKISFRVEETTIRTGEKKTIKISPSEEEDSWKGWRLSNQDTPRSGLNFKYFYKDQWRKDERYGNTTCDSDAQKLEPISNGKFGPGSPVKSSEITLSLSEGNQCRQYFSSVECDVNIDASGKLKWVEGKQPKIIYTAFK